MSREAFVAVPVSREMLDTVLHPEEVMAQLRKDAARKFEQLGAEANLATVIVAEEPVEMHADEIARLFPYLADRDDLIVYKWTAALS